MAKRWTKILAYCLALTLIGSAYFSRNFIHLECVRFEHLIGVSGNTGPLLYILISTLGLVLFVPRTTFLILGGIFFGTFYGVVYSSIASLLAALAGYYFAKTEMRSFIHRQLQKLHWFTALTEMSGQHGMVFSIITRNSHLHFGLVNLACGILSIKLRDYLIGSFIGLLPGTIAICYGASLFGCTLLDPNTKLPPDLKWKMIAASVFLTTVSFLPLLFKRKKGPPI